VTFLVVFLNPEHAEQGRSALHLKLDELILVTKDARNNLDSTSSISPTTTDRWRGFDALGDRVREHVGRRRQSAPGEPPSHPEEGASPVNG